MPTELMEELEGATALANREDPLFQGVIGFNPFDEFIIEGYENVGEEQSMYCLEMATNLPYGFTSD